MTAVRYDEVVPAPSAPAPGTPPGHAGTRPRAPETP